MPHQCLLAACAQDAAGLYWEDERPAGGRAAGAPKRRVKGGGVVGSTTELRYWEGDVSELGWALRADVGRAELRYVNDEMLTDWREQIVWDLHRKVRSSRLMAAAAAVLTVVRRSLCSTTRPGRAGRSRN